MSVYVDSLRPTNNNAGWPYSQACHMMADSTAELMDMANRIGLRPEWLQHHGRWSEHFDLTGKRRKLAIANGAIEMSSRELVKQRQAASPQDRL